VTYPSPRDGRILLPPLILEGLAWQGPRNSSPVHAQSLSPSLPIGQEGAMILAITIAPLRPNSLLKKVLRGVREQH
jgi:hypothetical protein